jgi:hypothetical protein
MWLSLLLAAMNDAAEQRTRRAALHELRQRLRPTEDARGPALVEILLDFAVRYAARYDVGWSSVSTTTQRPRREPFGYGKGNGGIWSQTVQLWRQVYTADGMVAIPWSHAERLADQTHMERFDVCWLSVPKPDLDFVTGIRLAPPTPLVRTEGDALLDQALRFWEASDFDPGVHGFLINRFPSLMDWVRAVHPPIRTLTWAQILEGSQRWHAQFQSLNVGCALPNALVVIRWPDGWTLQRLTEKKDFAGEGTSMSHCVGGPDRGNGQRDGESRDYQRARDDQLVVLSLRDAMGVPHATVSVTRAGVYEQVQGPWNGPLEAEADRRLREALWRMEAWGDLPVFRLGQPNVWSDAALSTQNDVLHAMSEARNAEEHLRRGMRHSGSFELTAQRLLSHLLHGTMRFAREKMMFLHQDEVAARSRAPGLSLTAHAMGGVRALNTRRSLLVYEDGDHLVYVVRPPEGPGEIELDLLTAIRAFTEVPREPPDTSHLEVYPGLHETFNFAWNGLLLPIAEARRLRSIQVLP